MKKLLECVPNFSEGRDMGIINQITQEIESVEGVQLLDVDPGKATNRTVVTFIGEPNEVIEAAFLAIKKASELIDMSTHSGEHARMGATDVCPLIPVSNISMEEAVEWSQKLGKRVGENLDIPIFMYEAAATNPKRSNLATIRSGEYEGLQKKLKDPNWKPDFGLAVFNSRSGATVIGARDFLVAYNINLNTKSTRLANAIAFDVREVGRVKKDGNPITGKILRDENGEALRTPGTLKNVKAVGWYIEEYGVAQISMNLTNIIKTPVHLAFEEVVKSAISRGARVTGSELVGLIPKKSMLEAGKYFLAKQNRSVGVPEAEVIHVAVKSLGLDELGPFDPKKKIIEYFLEDNSNKLIEKSLVEFADETSRESPAPGGGSVSAYFSAIGSSLACMVANLSANKRGWEERISNFSKAATKLQGIKDQLLSMVDEDTEAFNGIMAAIKMANSSSEEKNQRSLALEAATLNAIEVPLRVMKVSASAFPYVKEMIQKGNPSSVSDAGVAALGLRSGIYGAYLNVKINCSGSSDSKALKMLEEAKEVLEKSLAVEQKLLKLTEEVIDRS